MKIGELKTGDHFKLRIGCNMRDCVYVEPNGRHHKVIVYGIMGKPNEIFTLPSFEVEKCHSTF